MSTYEAEEDTSVDRGTLFFWLNALHSTEWPTFRDGHVMEDMVSGQAAIKESHLAQYEVLLGELHNRPMSVRKTLDVMLADSRTIIMCVWRVGTLLSTAQAVLVIEGGVPVVQISNVVTATTERG